MATHGTIGMAMRTASGNTALWKRPCRSNVTGEEWHFSSVRNVRWKFCSPKKTQWNSAHVAAALPQVSQDHRTQGRSIELVGDVAQKSFKGGSNGNGKLKSQEELNAEGMPCMLLNPQRHFLTGWTQPLQFAGLGTFLHKFSSDIAMIL